MTTRRSLMLDDEGYLFLLTWREDSAGFPLDDTQMKCLGPIDRAATRDEVPTDLEALFDTLADEWADRVEFGRACRETADHAWRMAKGC